MLDVDDASILLPIRIKDDNSIPEEMSQMERIKTIIENLMPGYWMRFPNEKYFSRISRIDFTGGESFIFGKSQDGWEAIGIRIRGFCAGATIYRFDKDGNMDLYRTYIERDLDKRVIVYADRFSPIYFI